MVQILLAEDHPLLREGMLMMFEEAGGTHQIVSLAENGTEVLNSLKSNPEIDLILLDVFMPATVCEDLIVFIVQNFPSVKILAVSVSDDANIVSKLFTYGLHGYISKFAPLTELLTAIDTLLENKIYLSAEMQLKIKSL